MLAWMLYATAVGGVLGVAGLVAERGARSLGLPVRWVWAVVLSATAGVPVLVAALGAPGAAGSAAGAARLIDTGILAAWGVASLVLLTSLRLSAWTLRRNERSWRSARVGGQRVRVSGRFGPGVIGAVRPRIVLPEWLLRADPALRRLVVDHEAEHVRAGDTTLLLAGTLAAVAAPWCVPLWWQLHRLRAAIEADCDARVLELGRDPVGYAHALVSMADRSTRRLLPVPTLAPRRSQLEQRIRLIAGAPGSRRAGPGLLAAAVAVVLTLGVVPAPPALPAPLLPRLSWHGPEVPAELPREAKVFLSIEPAGGPDR